MATQNTPLIITNYGDFQIILPVKFDLWNFYVILIM